MDINRDTFVIPDRTSCATQRSAGIKISVIWPVVERRKRKPPLCIEKDPFLSFIREHMCVTLLKWRYNMCDVRMWIQGGNMCVETYRQQFYSILSDRNIKW